MIITKESIKEFSGHAKEDIEGYHAQLKSLLQARATIFEAKHLLAEEYCNKVADGDTAYVSDVHHFASARDSFVVAGVETSSDESAYCK